MLIPKDTFVVRTSVTIALCLMAAVAASSVMLVEVASVALR